MARDRDRRRDWTAGVPVLLLGQCHGCRHAWYLPREHCPICGSDAFGDVVAAGSGVCVAATVLHATTPRDGEPVRLVLVELDEGPTVFGRAHDDQLAPGGRAVVAFRSDGHDAVLAPSFAREGNHT